MLGVHCHSQVLDRDGRGSMWRAGRAWAHWGSGRRAEYTLNPEWHLRWQARAGVALDIGGGDSDREVMVSASLPLGSFYLTFDGLPRPWCERILPGRSYQRWDGTTGIITQAMEIRVGWHDGALWWSLWHSVHEWSSRTPRWRHGAWHPLDSLLGSAQYSEHTLGEERVEVPMPEGVYPATVRLFESIWRRRRWPLAKRLRRAEITTDTPIPAPGKGENSWDCGEDATYSLTCPARTASAAIAALVGSVMRTRLRHGGRTWRPAARLEG